MGGGGYRIIDHCYPLYPALRKMNRKTENDREKIGNSERIRRERNIQGWKKEKKGGGNIKVKKESE